jgi:hypothetical protein
MGEPGHPPRRVKAVHNFKGKNNDEVRLYYWLCFSWCFWYIKFRLF